VRFPDGIVFNPCPSTCLEIGVLVLFPYSCKNGMIFGSIKVIAGNNRVNNHWGLCMQALRAFVLLHQSNAGLAFDCLNL
jgi:hypothetical protein